MRVSTYLLLHSVSLLQFILVSGKCIPSIFKPIHIEIPKSSVILIPVMSMWLEPLYTEWLQICKRFGELVIFYWEYVQKTSYYRVVLQYSSVVHRCKFIILLLVNRGTQDWIQNAVMIHDKHMLWLVYDKIDYRWDVCCVNLAKTTLSTCNHKWKKLDMGDFRSKLCFCMQYCLSDHHTTNKNYEHMGRKNL